METNLEKGDIVPDEEEIRDELEANQMSEFASISLQAILGKQTSTTMKLEGLIGKKEVIILVDSGSTHNFVSDAIVQELQLMMQYVPTFGVQIGNEDVIRCNSIYRDLEVQLPGLKLRQDFYPFPIGGADLVLGIQWLATLNTVQANWKDMFMIFTINGRQYKL